MTSTYIIAEAGVNHNGDRDLAFQLLEKAHAAGASAIKFQTFKADQLVTSSAGMADYQKANTGKEESQHAMLARLELGEQAHVELAAEAKRLQIDFLSTAFDTASLKFLTDEIGIEKLKVASGEITNAPFVLEHARTNLDIVMSTGMCTLAEVEAALSVLAFGWLAQEPRPDTGAFREAFMDARAQKLLQDRVTLLHCTTQYPTPPEDVNLRAMDTMRAAFGLDVGYSDHTLGITVPIAAVARGATVIEKHFTLDRNMEGPDHSASLTPDELKDMVDAIRIVETALGNNVKGPSPSELPNVEVARKSLVAATDIRAGELYSPDNVCIKRPGSGRSPQDYWQILGTEARRTYAEGELIVD